MDEIAVRPRARQRLEQHRADAFAIDEAVGFGAEAAALRAFREHAEAAQARVVHRPGDHVDAAGDRRRAFAAPQRFASEMQRGQGRRAGGIDRHARPLQVELVAHPVGDRPIGRVGIARMAVCGGATAQPFITGIHRADEYADRRALEGRGRITGILQHMPRGLQKQPLLRIKRFRFLRRDTEEQRIELVGIGNKAAPTAVVPAALTPGSGRHRTPIPARRGNLLDRRAAIAQQRPESIRIGSAREAARHADDGDRLVLAKLAATAGGFRPLGGCGVCRARFCHRRSASHGLVGRAR